MKNKEFIFEKIVYLGDVNIYGNVYFARYFEWQGMAREAFFKEVMQEDYRLFQEKVKFVTLEAYIKYEYEAKLFDEILIKVEVENIKTTTFGLRFSYINKTTSKVIAQGKQKIGFLDFKGKIVPIPPELKDNWIKFTQR